MNRVIVVVILFITNFLNISIGEARDFQQYVEEIKDKVVIERSYVIETEENLTLSPGEAARLAFAENITGVAEFIFFCHDDYERVEVIYRCTDKTSYQGTELNRNKLMDYRVVRASGSPKHLNIFSAWEPLDGKAIISFRTLYHCRQGTGQILKR